MKSKLYIWLIILIPILLIGCADSLYWSKLNTVEDIIKDPSQVENIINNSQFKCRKENLLNQSIINNIKEGKYYFYNEKYGFLYLGQWINDKYVITGRVKIHHIILRSPKNDMPDIYFLFKEQEGKWCLTEIVYG